MIMALFAEPFYFGENLEIDLVLERGVGGYCFSANRRRCGNERIGLAGLALHRDRR